MVQFSKEMSTWHESSPNTNNTFYRQTLLLPAVRFYVLSYKTSLTLVKDIMNLQQCNALSFNLFACYCLQYTDVLIYFCRYHIHLPPRPSVWGQPRVSVVVHTETGLKGNYFSDYGKWEGPKVRTKQRRCESPLNHSVFDRSKHECVQCYCC